MRHVIGMDIGHSCPKTVWASTQDPATHHNDLFPSVVTRAVALSDEPANFAAHLDVVTVRRTRFFVGKTAIIQGDAKSLTGLERDWVFSDEHDVLIMAALRRASAAGFQADGSILVIGLPSEFYIAQRKEVARRLAELIATEYNQVHVKVQQQPWGVLQTLALQPDGFLADGGAIDDQAWAVIDVGEFTTDVLVMREGQVVEKSRGSFVGAKAIKDRLAKALAARSLPNGLVDLNDALQRGHVKQFSSWIDVSQLVVEAARPFEDEVLNEASRLFGSLVEHLDGILLAGGGAPLVKNAVAQRYAHPNFVRVIPDSRIAIAEGFCRFALYMHHYQDKKIAA